MEPQRNNFKIVTSKKSRVILPNMLTLMGVCVGLTSIKFSLDQKSGVVGRDIENNDELGLIEFTRIKGGKPFDYRVIWFGEMLNDIGQ